MSSDQKFFKCSVCGNVVGLIIDSGAPLSCCGKKMEQLAANTTEASTEKHIPDVKISGDTVTVQVGSAVHPMLEEHHIEFIYLQLENGGQRKCLKVGDEPTASFKLADGDKLLEVYEYCNLHGLWKTDVSGN